ncbi:M24 family metallopeptidase [Paenibacillus cymbidii]|uniref:M24 family metallopeptidase n=1 Tax=Paenibacillus cymbidii TaxID=1639034 RepID=UPI001081C61A|nr:M24 family metallopeptidase [Paenibacillus cymbidii]
MQRWEKLALSMKEQGIDEIVVASQHAVRYLSGYSPDLEIGPNAMDPGPAVLRIERDGDALAGVMLLPNGAEAGIGAKRIACIGYDNYDVQTPGFDRLAAYRSGLAAWAQGRRGSGRKTAAEGGFLPLAAAAALGLDTGADDCTPLLNRIRQVKDEDELQALRAAAQLANFGQHAVRRFALEGVSEIECYGQVKAAIEQAAGKRLPLLVDFVSGARTADIGGYPSDRKLQAGDLLLTDLVPHLDGYWGDSCSVMAIGTYTARQLEVRKHVKEALELAKASIKPGASVAGTDRVVRDYLARFGLSFPHHTGHGLGVQCHEAPLISMNGDAAYEENMVIALEPGAYLADEGFGIRLEDVGRVTANGFEQWTQYE